MEDSADNKRPHVLCVPVPLQGHINPMFKLAKLLHSRGFFVTFVHTEFIYEKLTKAHDPSLFEGLQNFQFRTISDGLPAEIPRGILDLPLLAQSLPVHGLSSFRELVVALNSSSSPPVSCIVSDVTMGFTMKAAQEFGIPELFFFTCSACGALGYLMIEKLLELGYFPLKDESYLYNGYLDTTTIDWTPSMEQGMKLRDLPTFIRTTDPDDTMVNYTYQTAVDAIKTGNLILNTFDDLERDVLEILKLKCPNLYTIGPLSLFTQKTTFDDKLEALDSSLWKEDDKFYEWLDLKEPRSVVYVNFGSLVIMTPKQLLEFAWGLANSKYSFLWVIRPDLVQGGNEAISRDFLHEIEGRGLILDWCPQEKLLRHPSIGGFLTHCGWNSTLESVSEGVPMICWPFFAEQQMNCLYMCSQWEIGMDIDVNVERDEVEGLVRELMEGKKGIRLREKALEWKKMAERAVEPDGSSYKGFNMLVDHLLKG